MASQLFQIRRSIGATISGVLPTTPYPIGTPLMEGTIDPATGASTFVLANGLSDGVMTRDSRSFPGLTDTEQLTGFGQETPFLAGAEGSIEPCTKVEVECATGNSSAATGYILTDGTTGSITSSTALGTRLSFKNGMWATAQSGDYGQFRLAAIMTPAISGNLRICAIAVTGGKLA
jgi:hypothetical protein